MKKTLKVNYKIWEGIQKPQPIIVFIGGRGCVSADTLLDTPNGQVRIDEFNGGEVYALTSEGVKAVYAETPIRFSKEMIYKVSFSDGSLLKCTDQHRFLTPQGWMTLLDAHSLQLPICASCLPCSNLDSDLSVSYGDVLHCFQTLAGFLYSCYAYLRRYDLQPQSEVSTYLDAVQQLNDELQHKSHVLSREGDSGFWSTRSPLQLSHLLSNFASLLEEEEKSYEEQGNCNTEIFSGLIWELLLISQQFRESSSLEKLVQQLCEFVLDFYSDQRASTQSLGIIQSILERDVGDNSYSDLLSCNHNTQYITIESCSEIGVDYYYDLFVPIYNNYLSNKIVNHNSGKSLGVGDVLTFEMETMGYDVYCLREFQDSLGDSVHKVFKGSVQDRLCLDNWDIQQSTVIAPNGASTTYKGANRNPDAMQSAQGYLRSWFEEAHRASQASLDKLLPTILRNKGAKCIFTANPQSSGDAFSQRFIVPYLDHLEKYGEYEDDLHYICMVNWRDNPWWNEEQERLRQWDLDNLPRAKYDWIWEGKFLDTVDNAIILAEWFDACIDAHEKLGFKARGRRVAAHDPSDTGGDAKGYSYRHGVVFKDICTKETGDANEGADWAVDKAIRAGAQSFVWDCDGIGAALRRDISKGFSGNNVDQITFKGSNSPDHPDRQYEPTSDNAAKAITNIELFKNKRAQGYWLLRDRMYKTYRAVEFNEYCDPDELISFDKNIKQLQQLRSELCRIPRKWNGAGTIQIMSKPEMRTNGIQSPNMADSVMMCLMINDKIKSKKRPQPVRMPIV